MLNDANLIKAKAQDESNAALVYCFSFPENIKIDVEQDPNMAITRAAISMADKFDSAIAEQIAMVARADGAVDAVVLNKHAILAALKRATPQKVIIKPYECLCPKCSYNIANQWDYPGIPDPNYCPMCGQKLGWSDK